MSDAEDKWSALHGLSLVDAVDRFDQGGEVAEHWIHAKGDSGTGIIRLVPSRRDAKPDWEARWALRAQALSSRFQPLLGAFRAGLVRVEADGGLDVGFAPLVVPAGFWKVGWWVLERRPERLWVLDFRPETSPIFHNPRLFVPTHDIDMPTGAPGRPSKGTHLIRAEFDKRRDANTCKPSLREEAAELQQWFCRQNPNRQPPTVKTIENNIRSDHRQWAASRRPTTR